MAYAHSTITGIPSYRGRCIPFGPALRLSIPVNTSLYYNTCTTVQLPMRVLHGMYYSLPTVVVISYLMWLTNSWASGIALTNLLTKLYVGSW
jgi:hypothetical protein